LQNLQPCRAGRRYRKRPRAKSPEAESERKAAEARREQLLAQAQAWRTGCDIRSFVAAALATPSGELTPDPRFGQPCRWAGLNLI